MAQYTPWYLKRSCPIFCWPCIPVYSGIWSGRKFILIIGAVLFAIGLMMLLGLLLTCIAVECNVVAGALLPFALIFIIAGILFFHCGWAAHLLDSNGGVPYDKTTITKKTKVTSFEDESVRPEEADPIYEELHAQDQPEIRTGFWQFSKQPSWQAVTNPYPITHTLKPFVEREEYA